jgi:hypothetical protein
MMGGQEVQDFGWLVLESGASWELKVQKTSSRV